MIISKELRGLINAGLWERISESQGGLSEEFIDTFKDNLNWFDISRYQILSEAFIEKFQDKVSWVNISKSQILSESFIEKFQHKVDWLNISFKQHLSIEFIEKFKDKINWRSLSNNKTVNFVVCVPANDKDGEIVTVTLTNNLYIDRILYPIGKELLEILNISLESEYRKNYKVTKADLFPNNQ